MVINCNAIVFLLNYNRITVLFSRWAIIKSMATIAYLARRFVYRITEFFRHWYVKSVRIYLNFVINIFQAVDRYFAWKVTLHFIFHPLYGDYTIVGYTLGFIFRVLRLTVALIVYAVMFFIAVVLYAIWVIIPPYLILRPFIGYLF